jgi:hypothetical protein
MGLEPFQALTQFGEAEPLFARETMHPPVGAKLSQIFLKTGDRFQELGIAQLAVVT